MNMIEETSEKIKAIARKTWFIQGFNSCWNYIYHGPYSGIVGCHKYLGYGHTEQVFVFKKDYLEYFYLEEDLKKIGESFLKKYLFNQIYLKDVLSLNKKLFDKCNEIWSKLEEEGLNNDKLTNNCLTKVGLTKLNKKLSKKTSLERYKQAWAAYHYTCDIGHIIEGITYVLEPLLKKKLEKCFGCEQHTKKFRALFNELMQPIKSSFANEEFLDILNIIKKIKLSKKTTLLFTNSKPAEIERELKKNNKLHDNIYTLITDHKKRFFFNQINYFHGESLTELDYVREIKSLIESNINVDQKIKEETKRYINNVRRISEIKKQYDLDEETIRLVDLATNTLHWQDDRKKMMLSGVYYMNLALKQISNAYNIPLDALKRYCADEITPQLLSHFNLVEADKRKELFVMYTKKINDNICLEPYTGKDARLFIETHQQKLIESKDIHGMCASTGKTSGRVRVCKNKYDLTKFKIGEILVSSMTRPEFIPAMKKAAAIVTDEGGLTCHAAILSRELGKPCVIGTKIATKVLKDGDLVEVNANHGIVRKVK